MVERCVVETRTQLVVEECFVSVHKSVCFLCWFIGADLSAVMFFGGSCAAIGLHIIKTEMTYRKHP